MNTIMKRAILIAVAGIALAGCDNEPTRSVQFYLENEVERESKLAQCGNNPGELAHTPNCKNALAALNKALLSPDNTGMPQIK